MTNPLGPNRVADFLGSLMYYAAKGNSIDQAALAKHLLNVANAPHQDDLILAGESLASLWRKRLTTPPNPAKGEELLHPTEQGRVANTDLAPAPSGSGGTMGAFDECGADMHAFRQLAYGLLQLPCHPDVQLVLDDIRSHVQRQR